MFVRVIAVFCEKWEGLHRVTGFENKRWSYKTSLVDYSGFRPDAFIILSLTVGELIEYR